MTLSGESRPYLLVPKEGMGDQELAQFSPSQINEVSGWYVLHALNSAPFLEALAQGKGMSDAVKTRFKDTGDVSPIRIYLAESALNQIRESSAGEQFAAGSVKTALLSARLTSSRQALLFDGLGEASLTTGAAAPTPAGQVDQTFLSGLPPDATFVRLGANLASDIAAWQDIARVLDKSVLDQAAVAGLVRKLTSPYAFYERVGRDGSPDIGLIFTIPAEVTPPVVMGDTALE
ncbi:MAG: hypothetical protein AAB538_06095, partial [Patescibacteria group bacterium]